MKKESPKVQTQCLIKKQGKSKRLWIDLNIPQLRVKKFKLLELPLQIYNKLKTWLTCKRMQEMRCFCKEIKMLPFSNRCRIQIWPHCLRPLICRIIRCRIQCNSGEVVHLQVFKVRSKISQANKVISFCISPSNLLRVVTRGSRSQDCTVGDLPKDRTTLSNWLTSKIF